MKSNTVGRPMEILLIEDSLTSARLTMSVLKSGGIQHRLTWLSDGEDALQFLHSGGKFTRAPRPDLILLDLGLPKKDGRDVLSAIKSNGKLKSIPVVILTASTSQEDLDQSKQLQVEGYITKPVDINKFLELIKKLESYWQTDMIVPTSTE